MSNQDLETISKEEMLQDIKTALDLVYGLYWCDDYGLNPNPWIDKDFARLTDKYGFSKNDFYPI